MAQTKITDLPYAQPLTGAESVPIVQNGVTVQTTTASISSQPTQNQTFLTVTQQGSLPNSRYLATGSGLSVTDGGAQGTLQINLTGAAQSLDSAGNGIQVKTDANTLTARQIAAGTGLGVINADGVSGNPQINLGSFLSNFQSMSGSTGLVGVNAGNVSSLAISGTSGNISVANPDGSTGNPTINLTATGVSAGNYGSSTNIPVITVDLFGRITGISTSSALAGGTVTSVAALTLGTTGTDLSSTVANPTTTPVITLNVPTASATNRGALSAADWTTFNNKGSGTVTSVTGTAPVASSGGTTPAISMAAASASVNGYLTSTDWNTFNGKGSGSVTSVSFTGGIITVATASTTPALTVAGTSGGIPYFSSGTTWASSSVLAANALMIGGGAGATPATTTTGTGVLTALGNTTNAASGIAVKDANSNVSANAFLSNFVSIASSGITTILTVSSSPFYLITGSTSHTFQLPNATTLVNGTTFAFNNNSSAGTVSINNGSVSPTLIASVGSGGYITVSLLDNSTQAGLWDSHFQAPANTTWSTNTFTTGSAIVSTQTVQGTRLISTIATGTAPLTVASTTQVANLNAATAGTATNATNVALLAGTGATNYLTFSATATGNQPLTTNSSLTYNYTNNTLTAGISGGAF